jgi:hypothetical protein
MFQVELTLWKFGTPTRGVDSLSAWCGRASYGTANLTCGTVNSFKCTVSLKLDKFQKASLPMGHLSLPACGRPSLKNCITFFFASPCHSLPTGFRIRILFKPTNFVSVEREVYLSQSALGSSANRVAVSAQLDGLGVFHERLPPDID